MAILEYYTPVIQLVHSEDLIESIVEGFKNKYYEGTHLEFPITYSTPYQYNVSNRIITKGIKEYRKEKETWIAPMLDSLPSVMPVESIVYQMVCGEDLTDYSPSPVDEWQCTSQDDVETLLDQLPSFTNPSLEVAGFEFFGGFRPYTFKLPKLIKGERTFSEEELEQLSVVCNKKGRQAFETSLSVKGRKYKNLLEFVLDPQNIRSDIQYFWADKVESQYTVLMGCFETQYRYMYTESLCISDLFR